MEIRQYPNILHHRSWLKNLNALDFYCEFNVAYEKFYFITSFYEFIDQIWCQRYFYPRVESSLRAIEITLDSMHLDWSRFTEPYRSCHYVHFHSTTKYKVDTIHECSEINYDDIKLIVRIYLVIDWGTEGDIFPPKTHLGVSFSRPSTMKDVVSYVSRSVTETSNVVYFEKL